MDGNELSGARQGNYIKALKENTISAKRFQREKLGLVLGDYMTHFRTNH